MSLAALSLDSTPCSARGSAPARGLSELGEAFAHSSGAVSPHTELHLWELAMEHEATQSVPSPLLGPPCSSLHSTCHWTLRSAQLGRLSETHLPGPIRPPHSTPLRVLVAQADKAQVHSTCFTSSAPAG